MIEKVIDAEFEVVSGPTPVVWEPPQAAAEERTEVPWFKVAYSGLIIVVALYVLLLGLGGADIDTTDAKPKEPVAAALP